MTGADSAAVVQLGDYRLLERVGQGGTAHVYRAESSRGAVVAVKLLAPQAELDDAAARVRFMREIELLAELRHPHLLPLLDSGVDEELGPYLVTALVAGTTLRELIARRALCPEAALLLLEPVLDAVAALHAAGLVHRDLKPENVMAAPDGQVVVMDLGLAYRPGQTRHTEAGSVVGSVPYMAPEQLEGASITSAADIWALGVMAYEWMTGRRPFGRERPAEEAAAALVGVYPPLAAAQRRASLAVAELVRCCLQRDPAARPAAQELLDRVQSLQDWLEPGDLTVERAAVIADPVGYHARVAPVRVARLRCEAEQVLAQGKSFAALKLIDRALAYAPEDAELRALSERVAQGGAAPASGQSQVVPSANSSAVRSSSRGYAVAGAVLVLVTGVALGLVATRQEPPATGPTARSESAESSPAVAPPAASGVESAAPADWALALRPIPLAALSNDLPPAPDTMAAASGEALVSPELLGTRTPAEAIASLEAQLERSPGDPELRVGLAMVQLAAGQTDQGLGTLDAVQREYPELASGWAARGYVELRRGNGQTGDEALSRAIELNPTDASSLRNRAIYRHRLGRARDAYQDLVEALAADPNDLEALKELCKIYEQAGRRQDALPLLERGVRLAPSDPTAWLDLSIAQSPAAALTSIDRALALAPELPRAHELACTELARTKSLRAPAACERAVQLNPEEASNHMHRGLAYYHVREYVRALASLDRAIALEPDNASYFANRYIVRRDSGDAAGARADLEQACELGADDACSELRSP